jgi:outer membrane protein assembly factor BamB
MRRRTDGDPLFSPRLPPAPWLSDAATAHDVDVELVEEFEPPSGPARAPSGRARRPVPGRGVPATTAPRARPRGRAALVGTSLAAVAALVVALNVATESRSSAAAARLAAVPGILEPLAGPGTTWTRPDAFLLGVVDDVVLVSTGERMLEALDARTGAVRWTVGEPGATGWCTVLSDDHDGIQFERTTTWSPAGGDVVCYRSGWWADGADDAVRRRTLVEVVDPRSGRTTGTFEEDGRLVTSLLVAGDLVPVVARDDGSVVVSRFDPATGRTLWRTASEPGVATPDAAGTAVLEDGRTLTVRGRTRITLALADGAPLTSHAPVPTRRPTTQHAASPPVVDVDDRLAVLHRSDGTRVVRRGPGRAAAELWRTPGGRRAVPVADVAGVLLLASTSEVVAHDRATGRVLWRAPTAAAVDPVPLTDGAVVLLPVPGRGTTDLAAFGLADGLEAWRTPLPPGTRLLVPAGGAVVVLARDGVHGLALSP